MEDLEKRYESRFKLRPIENDDFVFICDFCDKDSKNTVIDPDPTIEGSWCDDHLPQYLIDIIKKEQDGRK